MISLKQTRNMLVPSLLLMLSSLSGCVTANKERLTTNICPAVEPLSKNILQAMQPDSTDLLKRAEDWSKSSEQLLNSVTPK